VIQKVLEAIYLSDFPDLQAKVIIGDSNPHQESLRKYCTRFSGRVELLASIENMAELMSWAEAAVSAAGNTCYELIYMTVPSLVVVVAQNQVAFAEKAHTMEICQSLGWYDKVSVKQIAHELRQFLFNPVKRKEQKVKQRNLRGFSLDNGWLINLERGVL
jgi:spore coat polysaccharide biosynthesis predicted glycosyltransferase SpsG